MGPQVKLPSKRSNCHIHKRHLQIRSHHTGELRGSWACQLEFPAEHALCGSTSAFHMPAPLYDEINNRRSLSVVLNCWRWFTVGCFKDTVFPFLDYFIIDAIDWKGSPFQAMKWVRRPSLLPEPACQWTQTTVCAKQSGSSLNSVLWLIIT